MYAEALVGEVVNERRRSSVTNDLAVVTHERRITTICHKRKHDLSFVAERRGRQLDDMRIGERIAKARTAAGVSQAKLGDRVGAVQSTVSSWERGRTEPTRDDVMRIANALGVAVADLEVGDGTERRQVRLAGYVGAGAEAHYYAEADDPNETVEAPEGSSEATVGVEVRGQSLGPLFERWIIYYDDVRSPVTPDLHGALCVVGLPDGRVLVKQLKPANARHHYHLISNANEPPIFDQEIIWAARVKGMRPR